METIKNYVEQMFRPYPADARLDRLKEEILANMLEKYRELKASGSSEHEAIGAVIAGFGDVDELIRELGSGYDERRGQSGEERYEARGGAQERSIYPTLTPGEVEEYEIAGRRYAARIAAGVGLCILGAAVFMLIESLGGLFGATGDLFDSIGVVGLLVMVVPAIGFFLLGNQAMAPFAYIEKGEFVLPAVAREVLAEEKAAKEPQYTAMTFIGIGLCVLSVCPVTLAGAFPIDVLEDLGVALLLVLVAAGVFLLVYAGNCRGIYDKLLKKDKKTKDK